MNKKLEHIWGKRWVPYAVAFLLPLLICLGICIADGVYPFGDKCILHVDMYHQYCPFFTEFMNKLKNGGSLMYSWNIGLGSDFISVFTYYLASPLNFLLIFCPQNHVIEFMTLLIVLKIAFAGFAFFCFIEYYDQTVHSSVVSIVFSTTYALSGFVAAYSWDIMWMDSIALAPLIILGLKKMIDEGKPAFYYISLSISILANYYISMMICIFLVFYFFLLVSEKKKKTGDFKSIISDFERFTLYSILSGGTGVILMYPEMKILSYSGSSGINFPSEFKWYFNVIGELARGCTNVSTYTGNDHWPNLYAGAFSFILIILYTLNTKIERKKKILRLLMIMFFLVSFANNYLDFIWHGFHFPDSLPGRQSFLYVFVVLVIGYTEVREFRGTKIWHLIVAFLMSGLILVIGFATGDESVSEKSAYLISLLFISCYTLMAVLIKITRGENRSILKNMAIGLAIAEIAVNMYVTGFYTLSRDSYMKKHEDYAKLLELAEKDALKCENASSPNEIFYRVEDTERMTKNDDALYGYRSATQFSSLMNINVSHFFQSFKMEGGKNYYCYNGATPLTSAMLSVKYSISDNPYAENDFKTLVGTSGEYYLYRNEYCLPIGYMMDEESADKIKINTSAGIEGINTLHFALGATDNMLEIADYDIECEPGETVIKINKDGFYYADTNDIKTTDSLTFSYPDGHSTTYSKTTHKYLFDLGYCHMGDEIKVSGKTGEKIMFYVYNTNVDAINKAYDNLNNQSFELERITDTKINGNIDVKKAGKFILSVPAEEGWKMKVDGEYTEVESFADTFICTTLKAGQHKIELEYQTPGLVSGAIVSSMCVIVFVLCCFIRKKILRNKVK